jgi:hypothetical protein
MTRSEQVCDYVAGLDFGSLGLAIAGLFVVALAVSIAAWKLAQGGAQCDRPVPPGS